MLHRLLFCVIVVASVGAVDSAFADHYQAWHWFRGSSAPRLVQVRDHTAVVPGFGDVYDTDVKGAAANWNSSTYLDMTATDDADRTSYYCSSNARNNYVEVCNVYAVGEWLGAATACDTSACSPSLINEHLTRAYVRLNDYWLASSGSPRSTSTHRRSTACHEIGHAIGLAHVTTTGSCMTSASAFPLYPDSHDYQMLDSSLNQVGSLYGYPDGDYRHHPGCTLTSAPVGPDVPQCQ